MPLDKGYIFKRERSIPYLLSFVLDSYYPKVSLKTLNEVVNLSYIPCPTIGWRSERILLCSSGHFNRSTIAHISHCGHAYIELSLQCFNPCLVGLNLGLQAWSSPSLAALDAWMAWISLLMPATTELIATCISTQSYSISPLGRSSLMHLSMSLTLPIRVDFWNILYKYSRYYASVG